MKPIIYLVLLLIGSTFRAQAQDCNCAETYDWVQEKLADNYAGYQDKVTAENRAAFEAHCLSYEAPIASVTKDADCHQLLIEWAEWFKDGHVQLNHSPSEEGPEAIRARYSNWPTIPLGEEQFRNYLDKQSDIDPLEGIWQSVGSNYQVGIQRNSDIESTVGYRAFILEADSVYWMPGQVKMELTAMVDETYGVGYFMQNHSRQEQTATLTNDGTQLNVSNLGAWYQLYPRQGEAPAESSNAVYSLEKVDKETVVITMPTMNEAYSKEFRALLKDNKDLLESTPNWIIDCRGNGGGSDFTYFPLRDYLATGDVQFDGMQTWATEQNAEKYLALRHDKNFSWVIRLWAGGQGRKMLRNTGQFIGGKECVSVDKYRKVTDFPQSVAVLIDDGCGSSCEQFVLFAEQSEKVTIMGQPSAGVLDYGNLIGVEAPCQTFTLYYPTTRSCRVAEGRGIDNIGIPPDIELSLEGESWITMATQQLKGNQE